MVDDLPSKAVPKVAALERRMLEEDLALGRTFPSRDNSLILTFCRFFETADHECSDLPSVMPMEHWAFYGKTVERLATAGALPRGKKEDFETAFMTANFTTST